jgi:hypothetical protein
MRHELTNVTLKQALIISVEKCLMMNTWYFMLLSIDDMCIERSESQWQSPYMQHCGDTNLVPYAILWHMHVCVHIFELVLHALHCSVPFD